MMRHIFMLVDCAHFYVSCERVFQVALREKPTIILSNNDSRIVALSTEAKRLSLKRGQPLFRCQKIIRDHDVQVFSSNYALYAVMSQRVMGILAEFCPRVEVYSIDEAWAELSGMAIEDLTAFGRTVKARVYQYTGIPVRVAIATSKCLTKIGCEVLKQDERYGDVLDLTAFTEEQLDALLAQVEVEDVWGVGRAYARFLGNYGVHSAKDLKHAEERWIRRHLTVTGARIQAELKGVSCFPLEERRPPKQEIICAKSFGREITSEDELLEAVSTYTARVAEKLREQDGLCGQLTVFIRTNPFAANVPHYANEFTIDLPHPTAFTPQLLKQARAALHAIYRDGFRYAKAGVVLGKITPLHLVQPDLFGEVDLHERYRQAKLMALVDALNRIFGRGTLVFATQGRHHTWRMRLERLSQRFTTSWQELLTIEG